MTKRKLRILEILCLCFIMTLGITRIPVSATKTSTKSYALTPESDFAIDSIGTITGYTGSSTTVNIPATINGIQVTAIGPSVFEHKSTTDVIIPNRVTSIQNNAFQDCILLENVTLPEGITSIGNDAFGYSAPFETQSQLNSVLIISDDPEHPDITHLELDKIDTQSNHPLNWYRGIIKPEINVKQSEIKSYTYEESEFYLTDIFEYKYITKIYQDKTGMTEYTGADIIIPEQYLNPDPTYSIVGTSTSRDTKVETGKLYIGSDETATNLKVKIKFGTLEKETNINRIPLHSISMKTLPKSTYTDGEKYDPTGLVINIKYDDGKTIDIKYNDTTKSDFTFNVDKITLSTSKQIITYRGKIVEHILTVTAKPIDEPQTPAPQILMYLKIQKSQQTINRRI